MNLRKMAIYDKWIKRIESHNKSKDPDKDDITFSTLGKKMDQIKKQKREKKEL